MTLTEPFPKITLKWLRSLHLLMPSHPETRVGRMHKPLQLHFNIREIQPGEESKLAELYVSSVREIGAQAYSEEQVQIWSSFGQHFAEFQARLHGGCVLVAETRHPSLPIRIIAFGQLETPEHLSLLYTAPEAARQGVATAIYRELEAKAIASGAKVLRTEASHISRTFFLKQGFRVVEKELVERKGVLFERFRMEKPLE